MLWFLFIGTHEYLIISVFEGGINQSLTNSFSIWDVWVSFFTFWSNREILPELFRTKSLNNYSSHFWTFSLSTLYSRTQDPHLWDTSLPLFLNGTVLVSYLQKNEILFWYSQMVNNLFDFFLQIPLKIARTQCRRRLKASLKKNYSGTVDVTYLWKATHTLFSVLFRWA